MAKIGYARVSTADHNPQLQLDALDSTGCLKVYTDHASGTKADRAQWKACLADLRAGDTLIIWRLSNQVGYGGVRQGASGSSEVSRNERAAMATNARDEAKSDVAEVDPAEPGNLRPPRHRPPDGRPAGGRRTPPTTRRG